MQLDDFIRFRDKGTGIAFVEQTLYRTVPHTRAGIQDGIERAAASLRALGVIEGDRVILWGENSARWVMTFYACVLSRIVVVPIDASFSATFVGKVQTATQAKLVFSDSDAPAWNQLFEGPARPVETVAPDPKTLLEIIYTSGTTAEPKGVMITHGNLLSNLVPVHNEIQKYKRYAIPFRPLGFVHLIPLSHLFGQIMALFIPQMLDGKVIFTDPAPPNVIRAIKKNRASVLICVPRQLGMLHKSVEKSFEVHPREVQTKGVPGVLLRWWHYRRIHRAFGWKFWAFISGGAALPVAEEQFWRMLGYTVIQGYGLTETAPSVTITHPFKIVQGSVGQKLPGVEVKIAADGEVLVRGENVTPGYYGDETATQAAFEDGWLRTGDLGRFDEAGNLVLLGRKKEVIVTSEGLNVYPQDVEDVLNVDPRVRESAVVASVEGGPVHAVLVLQPGIATDEVPRIVSDANRKLERHQQIRSGSVWPEKELPRTSTGKLRRTAVAAGSTAASAPRTTEQIVARLLAGVRAGEDLRLDQDLGLSSLERVELMVELEQASGAPIDDAAFSRAKSLSEIADLVRALPVATETAGSYPEWQWPTHAALRLLRFVSFYGLVFPLLRLRVRVEATGVEHLPPHPVPLLFVSNHQSILDVPAILRALPSRYRMRLAPAMGTGRKTIEMLAAGLFFNTYPLPGTSVGLRGAIQHTGLLVDCGYSPLVFPEGERTRDGKMQPFRQGIGVITKHVGLPVVPVRITGAYEVWPMQARGPGKGVISVCFGKPLDLTGKDPATITNALEIIYR
jgi:long-chain acyl-CoA synthetase